MTIRELVEQLQRFPDQAEARIFDMSTCLNLEIRAIRPDKPGDNATVVAILPIANWD